MIDGSKAESLTVVGRGGWNRWAVPNVEEPSLTRVDGDPELWLLRAGYTARAFRVGVAGWVGGPFL